MVDFSKIDHDSHDMPVLVANVPGLHTDLYSKDDAYPINTTFKDVNGKSHKLQIDEDLSLTINGDDSPIKKLYELLYGIETDEGKQEAYQYESDYHGAISQDAFRCFDTTENIDELNGVFSFEYEPTKVRFRPLPHLNVMRYYSMGRNGKPIAYKDYALHSKGLKWQQRGVFRLPTQMILSSNRVLVVGNPVVADFLQDKGICAIPLPSEHEINFYNYPQLFDETEILFCLKEYGQTYNYSRYPLAAQLIRNNVPTSKVNIYNLLDNESIPNWIHRKGVKDFVESLRPNSTYLQNCSSQTDKSILKRIKQKDVKDFVESLRPNSTYLQNCSLQTNKSLLKRINQSGTEGLVQVLRERSEELHASDIPTRKGYNRNRDEHGKTAFNPAQDVHKTSMIYSFGDWTVLSNPIRRFKTNETLGKMENLSPVHDHSVDSALTLGTIDRIRNGDYLKPSQLYLFIRKFIRRYLYFEDEEVFDILAAWVMGTYIHRLFLAYPYIHFHGEKGTGKTTILKILSELGFNGQTLTKATPSALTHQVHYHSSTLCVDEFEDYSSRRKSEDELSRFLNGGYHEGGSYKKRSGKGTVEFNTYSPKAFGGTGKIFIETLRSRAIPISTLKKPENVPKVEFSEFDQEVIDDMRLIQLSCYGMGLQHTPELIDLIAGPTSEVELPVSKKTLGNRQLQLARPLLVISKFIENPDVRNAILRGLDLCWSTNKADQIRIIKAARKLLKKLVTENEPDDKKGDYYYFITNELLETPLRAELAKKHEIIGHKGKFNEILADHFDVDRDSDYVTSTQKNESIYKIPQETYQDLKG